MNIEEGPFETLDFVVVALNNDSNEFKNSANKENMLLPKIKSTCSC